MNVTGPRRVSDSTRALVRGSAPVASSHALEEGKRYTSKTAFGGEVFVTRRGAKYEVELPLVFTGGLLFSLLTPEGAQRLAPVGTRHPMPAEFFQAPGARSIAQIPALSQHVARVVAEIEAHFQTDRFTLRIRPELHPDETTLLRPFMLPKGMTATQLLDADAATREAAYKLLQAELNQGTMAHTGSAKRQAVLLTPTPSAQVVTPTLWDPNPKTNPSLLAHETGHLLGIQLEGFMLDGYPLDGLMNDEYAMHALRGIDLSLRPRLTEGELNEVMRHLVSRAQGLTPAQRALGEQEFAQTIQIPANSRRMSWFSLSEAERQAILTQDVKRYLAERGGQPGDGASR